MRSTIIKVYKAKIKDHKNWKIEDYHFDERIPAHEICSNAFCVPQQITFY